MVLESILDVCQQDISINYWRQFLHSTLRWLVSSPMNSLLSGGMLVLAFLIVSGLLMRGFILMERGRSIKRLWLWGFPLALLISVSPLLIGEPLLTTFLPIYDGQTADAVVVLGRGRWLRADRALRTAELIKENSAPQIFISGRDDAPAIARMLVSMGIEPNKISGENCSWTTEENARYTAQQLLPAEVESIILVSDPTHLLRSQLVFKSFGFKVIPYSSPLPTELGLSYRRLVALRESVGFVAYGLMGRYWPR
ncbi:MAG: YdcF family protein, partial [Leptolyngbya sp. SIO3F4]|nr:YdcF family protein [Leptolyngbya sp. SIO3F4]